MTLSHPITVSKLRANQSSAVANFCVMPVDSSTFVRLFSEGIPKNAPAETLAKIRTEGAESDSASRQLARFVADVADREGLAFKPKLIFRQDRFLRGGDHSAFNDAGFPGVRFTVPGEDYSRQHADVTTKDGQPYGDLPRFVSGEYVANVARLNAAAIVHLANAPRPPPPPRQRGGVTFAGQLVFLCFWCESNC